MQPSAIREGTNGQGLRGHRPKPGELSMKNGFYRVALLAGGPADVYREIREYLAKRKGVDLRHHWEWKTNAFSRPIPEDVDFVMFLKDMAGHPDWDAVRVTGKRQGIPVMGTQHKKSVYGPTMGTWGIIGASGSMGERSLLRDAKRAEYEACNVVSTEPAKLFALPPPALTQEEAVEVAPQPEPMKPVEVTAPVTSPVLSSRRGIARPETLAALARLQQLAWEDGVAIMVTGRELSVTPLAAEK